MDKKDIKVGQKVYVVKKYGTIKDGFEMQILDYEVGWIGEDSILVKHYWDYREPEIKFYDLYSTLEEAMNGVKNIRFFKDKKVEFKKIYGSSYNVIWDE